MKNAYGVSVRSKPNLYGVATRSRKPQDQNYGEDWAQKRQEVIKRDRNTCTRCGHIFDKGETREVHHLISLSKSGTNRLSNLTLLCQNCHDKEHASNSNRPARRRRK